MKYIAVSLLLLTVFFNPLYAQQDEEPQHRVCYMKIDGVKIKVTLSGSPKVMDYIAHKELKIRDELLLLHKDVVGIQKRLAKIYGEMKMRCPFLERMYKRWCKRTQKRIHKQEKKLKKAHECLAKPKVVKKQCGKDKTVEKKLAPQPVQEEKPAKVEEKPAKVEEKPAKVEEKPAKVEEVEQKPAGE